ncbi:hypothetical protein FQZ97_961470 [compost metagenome]
MVGNLLARGRCGHIGRHDEGNIGAGLGQGKQRLAEGLAQRDGEGLVVDGGHFLGSRGQLHAQRVLLGPAAQRGDHVGGGDRRAIGEGEAIAQREGIEQAIIADRMGVDHLRLDLEVRVDAEQRVIDHVAVVSGHGVGREDRVQHFEIGRQHGPQGRFGMSRSRQGN